MHILVAFPVERSKKNLRVEAHHHHFSLEKQSKKHHLYITYSLSALNARLTACPVSSEPGTVTALGMCVSDHAP